MEYYGAAKSEWSTLHPTNMENFSKTALKGKNVHPTTESSDLESKNSTYILLTYMHCICICVHKYINVCGHMHGQKAREWVTQDPKWLLSQVGTGMGIGCGRSMYVDVIFNILLILMFTGIYYAINKYMHICMD